MMGGAAGQAPARGQLAGRTCASVAPAVRSQRQSRCTGRWTVKGRENLQECGGAQGVLLENEDGVARRSPP